MIYEIMNSRFNFQQNISHSNFRHSVMPFSRVQQRASPFPMCFSSNNDPFLTGNKFVISFRMFIIQRLFFLVWFLVGIFLENIFLTCGLNSFQQLEISIPF